MMTGSGAANRSLMMRSADDIKPPGVSSSMTRARAPPICAEAIESSMKCATAGLIDPSILISSTQAWPSSSSSALGAGSSAAGAGEASNASASASVASAIVLATGRRNARTLRPCSTTRNRAPECSHDFLYITPDQPFVARISQQVGGMKGRHHFDAAHFVPVAAQLADRSFYLEHRLHREGAEPHDDARLDHLDLPKQEGLAGFDFVGLGIAIARRAALDDVTDVNFGALHPHPALDDIGEQL